MIKINLIHKKNCIILKTIRMIVLFLAYNFLIDHVSSKPTSINQDNNIIYFTDKTIC